MWEMEEHMQKKRLDKMIRVWEKEEYIKKKRLEKNVGNGRTYVEEKTG